MFGLMEGALAHGWDVTLASPAGSIVDALPAKVSHIEISPLGLSGEAGLRRITALVMLCYHLVTAGQRIRRRSRDSLIVVNSLYALPAVRFAGFRRRCAWLVHDTISYPKQRAAVKFSAGVITKAVAVSNATAAPLIDLGIPTVVCYNGVRLADAPSPRPLSQPPIVGVLAAITPWKGQDVAIEAIAKVPGVHLELAGGCFQGDEPFLEALKARAAQPDVAGRVHFLGHSDAGECLRRWDAVLSPSVAPEAGPIGVLEAMSAGTPVVATRHGGAAEYLDNGRGVLVNPKDPEDLARGVREVLSDEAHRLEMITSSWSRVAQVHDISTVRSEMLAAITDQDS